MYPIVVLSSWILASILENVVPSATYASEILIKRFLAHNGPNSSSIKYTPLVRIFAFTQPTPTGELVAVANDATHKIVVVFTRDAILRFESRYGQRLTYESVGTLMILRQANLRFINRKIVPFIGRALGGIPKLLIRETSMLYLEVSEVEFFLRDQHNVSGGNENMLNFVYCEDEYAEFFGVRNKQKSSLNSQPSDGLTRSGAPGWDALVEDYDGIVSEYEEDELILALRSDMTEVSTDI